MVTSTAFATRFGGSVCPEIPWSVCPETVGQLAPKWCGLIHHNLHHDTLIIGAIYENDVWLSLWVDTGTGGMPVAMAYQSDTEVQFTPVYKNERYAKSLSEADVKEIFDSIFSDTTQLNIKQE